VNADTGQVLAGRLPMNHLVAEDDPSLCKLLEWASQRCATKALTPECVRSERVLDLDAGEVVEVEGLADVLAGAETVAGGIVETDEGIAVAIRAGVRTIVTSQPLPVLLAALAVERDLAGKGELMRQAAS
jgi:pyruvate,orthophosphate dikinase